MTWTHLSHRKLSDFNVFSPFAIFLQKMWKSAQHEWNSKCLPTRLPVSCSNLSLVLPKSGNASFPGETKLLLYHSGPQVFQCSVTVSCKRRRKGTFTDANLSPPHTNALCNASAFSKGSRVPYHWFCSQLACNSRSRRLMHRTHNETLFVFFMILNHDLISPLQLWVWSGRCQQRSED